MRPDTAKWIGLGVVVLGFGALLMRSSTKTAPIVPMVTKVGRRYHVVWEVNPAPAPAFVEGMRQGVEAAGSTNFQVVPQSDGRALISFDETAVTAVAVLPGSTKLQLAGVSAVLVSMEEIP